MSSGRRWDEAARWSVAPVFRGEPTVDHSWSRGRDGGQELEPCAGSHEHRVWLSLSGGHEVGHQRKIADVHLAAQSGRIVADRRSVATGHRRRAPRHTGRVDVFVHRCLPSRRGGGPATVLCDPLASGVSSRRLARACRGAWAHAVTGGPAVREPDRIRYRPTCSLVVNRAVPGASPPPCWCTRLCAWPRRAIEHATHFIVDGEHCRLLEVRSASFAAKDKPRTPPARPTRAGPTSNRYTGRLMRARIPGRGAGST